MSVKRFAEAAGQAASASGSYLKLLINLRDKLDELEKKAAAAEASERVFVERVLEIIEHRQILRPETERQILAVPGELDHVEQRLARIESLFDIAVAQRMSMPAPATIEKRRKSTHRLNK